MEGGESKKLALLYILEILKNETDLDHPLYQEDIAERLASRYGIPLERKAIGRNLALLADAGYDIVNNARGTYLATRDFEPSELRLLIDSVLFSKHIGPSHSTALVEKLSALGGKHFAYHRRHTAPTVVNERNKNAHGQLFFAIDMADEAIERGRRLCFTYQRHGADKKLHKSSEHITSPYQMLLHNQHYYLMAYSDTHKKMSFFRMDKMSDVKIADEAAVPLRSVPGSESGIDYKRLSSTMPYLYSDPPIPVTFTCPTFLLDQVIDWFGYDISVRAEGEDAYRVTVQVSPPAMEFWALQYAKFVRVIAPLDLRERIAAALRAAADAYADGEK